MNKNRNHYIGARFTEDEKNYIEKIAQKYDLNLSDLLREAIFSHIKFLEQFKDKKEIEKAEFLFFPQKIKK